MENGNFALAREETELDIEGLTQDDDRFWVIGSHSMKRKSLKTVEELKEKRQDGKEPGKHYNRDRMETVAVEPSREWLYRLTIKSNGEVKRDSIRRGTLRNIFANHPVLSRFRNIPSKENGIDKEKDGYLVLAGPVGDEPSSYLRYHWNGKDTIPEIDRLDAEANIVQLCDIPPPESQPEAKAEGIHFLDKEGDKIRFVIVYDSAENGAASVFSCKLKRS